MGTKDNQKQIPRKGKKKWIFLILLVIIAGAVFWFLQKGSPGEAVSIEEDIELNPDNSQLYSLLSEAGITDAMIDVQKKETLIALSIPQVQNKEDVLSFVYGAATGFSHNADKITVHILTQSEVEEYSVTTENVVKYADGKLTKEEFNNAVIKQTFPLQ